MFRIVARLSTIAVPTPLRSPGIKDTSAASMATSVPVPMAMPTSACASAGASFIPAPTMATILPSSWSVRTSSDFSSGSTSASTRSMPA